MSVLSYSIMSAIRKVNGTKDGNKEVGYCVEEESRYIQRKREKGRMKNGWIQIWQYNMEGGRGKYG